MKDRAGNEVETCNWHSLLPAPGSGAAVEALGPDHAVLRAGNGPVLLVSFERAHDILSARIDGRTLAARLAEPAGRAWMTVVARGETWFRDPAVHAHFDRLIDEGYFDRFDRVVFYGAEMCGYAAAAFSVAAPGAIVIALGPQATLAPRITGWDTRFPQARRRDFTTRFGYAPDMVEAAECALIVHDPMRPLDAMHAALFSGPGVMQVRAPFCGAGIEANLMAMGVLPGLIDAAAEGRLAAPLFHRLFRARRRHAPYLQALLDRIEAAHRPRLAAVLYRHILSERPLSPLVRGLVNLGARLTGRDRSESTARALR